MSAKKGSSRYGALTVYTTPIIILGEASDRKSLSIQNTSNANNLWVSSSRNFDDVEYIEIPTNSVLHLKIPEDNPREALWARASANNCAIKTYEAYAK